MDCKKNIAVYTGGDRSSINYYRVWQYIDNLQNINVNERLRYRRSFSTRYSPIGYQNLFIKIVAWLQSYYRLIFFLIADCITKPDLIFVQREFSKKVMTPLMKCLVMLIKHRGTKILWDFDDQILAIKELSSSDFNFLSKTSDVIVATHKYLGDLVPKEYSNKVYYLPTTDGDMYRLYKGNSSIEIDRTNRLSEELVIVWVATKGNLKYLEQIIPILDKAALRIREQKGIKTRLKVVCNAELCYNSQEIEIENIQWTRSGAINEMLHSHVGIMPLSDNEFTRGKGSFKLIQYMSVGLPCVASNVGFNKEVIKPSLGYLTMVDEDWINALYELTELKHWKSCSFEAYKNWEELYSYESNLSFFQSIIDKL